MTDVATIDQLEELEGVISHQRHDVVLSSLHRRSDGLCLRVKVRRNFYDFQSSAEVDFLTPGGWQSLWAIPYTDMAACADASEEALIEDEKRLLEIALRVLASPAYHFPGV